MEDKIFINAKVIVENRHNGLEPAITIIENGIKYIITTKPDGNWWITNEGPEFPYPKD